MSDDKWPLTSQLLGFFSQPCMIKIGTVSNQKSVFKCVGDNFFQNTQCYLFSILYFMTFIVNSSEKTPPIKNPTDSAENNIF